jgi:hypothetical protein
MNAPDGRGAAGGPDSDSCSAAEPQSRTVFRPAGRRPGSLGPAHRRVPDAEGRMRNRRRSDDGRGIGDEGIREEEDMTIGRRPLAIDRRSGEWRKEPECGIVTAES